MQIDKYDKFFKALNIWAKKYDNSFAYDNYAPVNYRNLITNAFIDSCCDIEFNARLTSSIIACKTSDINVLNYRVSVIKDFFEIYQSTIYNNPL